MESIMRNFCKQRQTILREKKKSYCF